MTHQNNNYLGFGIGLRPNHYDTIITEKPCDIDWFEIISENFMVDGGKPLYYLEKIRSDYPMVMHGVSMSLAGPHEIDKNYLNKLSALINRVEPMWISDHLAWTRGNAHNFHDLLPIPYTTELLNHICNKINQTQDYLNQQILIENPSSYATFIQSDITEYEFLNQVCECTGCFLLLDINNIFVSFRNHDWNPSDYIRGIKPAYVKQHHLAGHSPHVDNQLLIDTHDSPVSDDVWKLYAESVQCFGKVSTMIERDDNIPPLDELIIELQRAQTIQHEVLGESNSKII